MKINLKEIEARCKAHEAIVAEFPDLFDKVTVTFQHGEAVAMANWIRRAAVIFPQLKFHNGRLKFEIDNLLSELED